MKAGPVLFTLVWALAGCGSGPGCTYTSVLSVLPGQATVSSSAAPPANQQKFTAGIGEGGAGTGCVIPAVEQIAHPVWTNPDTVHISISSANDSTNGVAVCKGPTAGPVTLTATATSGTGSQVLTSTVQLTCN